MRISHPMRPLAFPRVLPVARPISAPPVFRPQALAVRPPIIQRKAQGQPKFYPNLNAAAAIPVDRDEIFKLHTFQDYYRIQRGRSHGQLVANSKYIFVRTLGGEIMLHPTYRHPVLAGGQPVLYAGEMFFDNGRLSWWSNGSGNYRPDPEHAEQANLPMDRFYMYQDILKGRHRDRQASAAAESGER